MSLHEYKANNAQEEELREIMSIQDRSILEERIKTLISDRDKSQTLLGEWSPIVHSKESTGGPSACRWCANKDLTCLTPPDEEGPGFSIEHFNYKEEKDRYWHDRNQENARSYYGMD